MIVNDVISVPDGGLINENVAVAFIVTTNELPNDKSMLVAPLAEIAVTESR
jgi:hypothetical protein